MWLPHVPHFLDFAASWRPNRGALTAVPFDYKREN